MTARDPPAETTKGRSEEYNPLTVRVRVYETSSRPWPARNTKSNQEIIVAQG